MTLSAEGRNSGVIHSTATATVVVAFRSAQADPAAAALAATEQPAWEIAQAKATSARALSSDAAAVTFDTTLSRKTAAQISAAAAKASGVKYAEPSVTFYPTDAGGSGYYWNVDQINASAAWATAGKGKSDVVVAVIDTGIADNPLLRKALLVDTIGGVTSGTTVSGTTWPGRAVTITYTSVEGETKRVTAPADAQGKWSIDLDPKPIDGTTLTASMTDASENLTKTDPIKVDSTVTEFSVHPSNGSGFHGTVEPGSKVTLSTKDPSGKVDWSAEAVVDGATWTLTPSGHVFADGEVVTVSATDKRGNTDVLTVTIDQISELSVNSPSNGTITGSAEAGSTISVTLKGEDGAEDTALCPGLTAGEDASRFTCTPDPALADGATVKVIATDLANNDSPEETVIIDTVAPALSVAASNGTELTGTVDDHSFPVTITASFPGDVTKTVTVNEAGTWTLTDLPTLGDGDEVTVTATDAADNVTDPAESVTIDQTPPETPLVNPTNGEVVNGTGEPGATVSLCYDSKRSCATERTGTVAKDRTWSFAFDPALADRTWVKVILTDAAGNTSDAASRQVHYGAPSAPAVAVSDGTLVSLSGVVEGDQPTIVDSTGEPVIGTWTDLGEGHWNFVPENPLTEADTVFARVVDSDGTASADVAVTIDTIAPDAPSIAEADTTRVSGTGEPEATISVGYTDAEGAAATATTTVNADGTWAVSLDPAAGEAATITVTQTDRAGHISPEASVTLVAPSPSPEPEPEAAGTGATGVDAPSTEADDVVGTVGSGTVLPGYDFISAVRSPYTDAKLKIHNPDGDGDGRDPDPTDLAEFVGDSVAGNPQISSHGTHVAGIVAAQGAGASTGVAPGVSILPVRVIPNEGGGDMPDVAAGILWAAGEPVVGAGKALVTNPHPADVINLSLGGYGSCSTTLQSAINVANSHRIPVIVSAGNDNSSIAGYAPANCSGVIVVTASTNTKTRATYSNWGEKATSAAWLVAAPGGSGDVSHCWAWYTTPGTAGGCAGFVTSTIKGVYQPMYGTSMAAPHVAGTAALLKSLEKSFTPAQIAAFIRGTATTKLADGCPTGTCGPGIVNAGAAVEAAAKAKVSPNSGTSLPVSVSDPTFPTTNYKVSWPKKTRVGHTLRVSNAGSNYGATYQWYRSKNKKSGGEKIKGATASSYVATRTDYGKYLYVTVKHLSGVTQTSSRSPKVTTGNLRALSPAWISGTAKVGQKLTAHKPVWSDSVSSTKYQWYRNGKTIRKATKSTYKLTKSDRGKKITVKVSVKSSRYYSTSTKSAATARVQ